MLKLLLLVTVVARAAVALDTRTIDSYLSSNPAEFSVLMSMLKSTHLDLVLEAPGAIFTVFAPTDAAFNRLPPALLQKIQGDRQLLQSTLMSHVANDAVISLSMQNDKLHPTLSGKDVRFNIYNQIYTVDGARVTQGDIVLRNGVIHVIDGVILPAEGDILREILLDDAEFEDLTAAFTVTNLLNDLELDPITVFAPVNAAFRSFYNSSLPDSVFNVKGVLLNHMVNGTHYPAGLQDGDTLVSWATKALHFGRTAGGVLTVNGHPTDGVIYATNGLIHVMTSVLGPPGV